MTRVEDNSEFWIHMLKPILNSETGRDANLFNLKGCPQKAPEEGSEASVFTELNFHGWMLPTTTDYEHCSTEVTSSLSHVAGYVSVFAVLTPEAARMKKVLFTADLSTGPAEIEPIPEFLCNVKTSRVLFTMPACEEQQLHADVG